MPRSAWQPPCCCWPCAFCGGRPSAAKCRAPGYLWPNTCRSATMAWASARSPQASPAASCWARSWPSASTAITKRPRCRLPWRIPFILGGVFGMVSVYLRRFLQETPIFKELEQLRHIADELPVKTVLREHRWACVIVALLTWVLSAAIVVVVLFTPTYL